MKFYIDLEATQPEQEIIEIGIACENGKSFFNYIKPTRSKVSPFIAQLTGITNEMLKDKENFDAIMRKVYYWIEEQCDGKFETCEFYCYGNGDIDFLRKNVGYAKLDKAFIISCILIARMEDYSPKAKAYFNGNVSLIDAFNYICRLSVAQEHNALKDAVMLNMIANEINKGKVLEDYPFDKDKDKEDEEKNYNWPKGTFTCCTPKGKKVKTFNSCEEAVDWVIKTIPSGNRVYKNRIAMRIMKAIRKKTLYTGHYWSRKKE